MNIVALLFPEIALIAIGWGLYRGGRFSDAFWSGAEQLVYFVLFPALLFGALVRNPVSIGASAPMLAAALGAFAVGIALGFLARPLLAPSGRRFASGVQCAFRFNSYITLALALRLGGDAGLSFAALLVGVFVPAVNFAAVYALARHSGAGVARELARNPLVIATVAGLAAKSLGLQLPEPVDATLTRLGQAALGIGLILVGAGLRLERGAIAEAGAARQAARLAAWFGATKLLVMPLVALALAQLFALEPLARVIVVLFAAVPPAPAAYVLTTRMGGDGRFVALLITGYTLASLATLPLWLWAADQNL
ncbi:MAG: AEC family transporter [Burkholderiaceae bacterium]|nr:AEC family transporter [Burkholderiaceae bacterium]